MTTKTVRGRHQTPHHFTGLHSGWSKLFLYHSEGVGPQKTLVHFSKLIVSWNAMENAIRAVHVCNCASYISVHVCVQPCLHLMRFKKFVHGKLLYFCIPGL